MLWLEQVLGSLETIIDIARYMGDSMLAAADDAATAKGMFVLVQQLSESDEEQHAQLVFNGVIESAAALISRHVADEDTQTEGLKAFAALMMSHQMAGIGKSGLIRFRRSDGFQHVENALKEYRPNAEMQALGLHLLSKSFGFQVNQTETPNVLIWAVQFATTTMRKHVGHLGVQLAGIKALDKFVDEGAFEAISEESKTEMVSCIEAALQEHSDEFESEESEELHERGSNLLRQIAEGAPRQKMLSTAEAMMFMFG